MNLSEAVPKYIDELIYGRNLSTETVRAYAHDLEQFLTFLEEYLQKPLDQLTLDDIDQRIVRSGLGALKLNGNASSTVGRKLSALRAFFNFIIERQGHGSNPAKALRTPKKDDKTPSFLTRDETRILLEHPFDPSALGARNKAILEMLYATGMRVSELTSLNMANLSIESRLIRVTGKGDKMREVVFGTLAAKALNEYLDRRSELLAPASEEPALFLNFRGGRLSSRSVARMLRKRLLQVGLACNISPHSLRHTFATHMLNNGADIRSLQELLGHSSLSTTQKYTRVGVEELMLTYLKCHPRAK
jgi:integrase/recombinase XerC